MEKHIFKKRQQYAKYISIRENRGRKEKFITPNFNKNYSNCNKMRPKVHKSAYFGNKSFSLYTRFTAISGAHTEGYHHSNNMCRV